MITCGVGALGNTGEDELPKNWSALVAYTR